MRKIVIYLDAGHPSGSAAQGAGQIFAAKICPRSSMDRAQASEAWDRGPIPRGDIAKKPLVDGFLFLLLLVAKITKNLVLVAEFAYVSVAIAIRVAMISWIMAFRIVVASGIAWIRVRNYGYRASR